MKHNIQVWFVYRPGDWVHWVSYEHVHAAMAAADGAIANGFHLALVLADDLDRNPRILYQRTGNDGLAAA